VRCCVCGHVGMHARVRGTECVCNLDMCRTIIHASSYRNNKVN
jgi:hypothetical protein